jgi:tetratricopeptide (TPR) repeat protein
MLKYFSSIMVSGAIIFLLSGEARSQNNAADYYELNELGVKKALGEKDFRAASDLFRRAFAANSACFKCLYNLGWVQLEMKRYTEAAATFESLIGLAPGYTKAYAGLGEALSHGDASAASIPRIRRALELMPGDIDLTAALGLALAKAGEHDEAVRLLTGVIEKDPAHGAAYNNRGFALFLLGRPKQALEDLTVAARLLPNSPTVLNNLGLVHERLGNEKKGREFFRVAIEADPDFADARYNLALNQLKDGNRDEAHRQLSILRDSDPVLAEKLRQALWDGFVVSANKKRP